MWSQRGEGSVRAHPPDHSWRTASGNSRFETGGGAVAGLSSARNNCPRRPFVGVVKRLLMGGAAVAAFLEIGCSDRSATPRDELGAEGSSGTGATTDAGTGTSDEGATEQSGTNGESSTGDAPRPPGTVRCGATECAPAQGCAACDDGPTCGDPDELAMECALGGLLRCDGPEDCAPDEQCILQFNAIGPTSTCEQTGGVQPDDCTRPYSLVLCAGDDDCGCGRCNPQESVSQIEVGACREG